jgi:hypothetical protein
VNPTSAAHPDSSDQYADRFAAAPDPAMVVPVGAGAGTGAEVESEADITRAFSTSMVVSGIRCLLAYIVFPWILPLLGVAGNVGPAVGLAVGVVAIGFNVASIRRFMRTGHRYRYWIATINVVVIGMLLVLIVRDVADLLG